MKIIIKRGRKTYEAVPCGKKCDYYRRTPNSWTGFDFCGDDCHCPKWWFKTGGINGLEGLHKIGGEEK